MARTRKPSTPTADTTVQRSKPGETCPAAVDGTPPAYAPELEHRPAPPKE